jgi:flagellar biosynthesis protein FliQ
MPLSLLVHDAELALWLAVAISVPVLAVAATLGLFVAVIQAASQIQDPTLAHFPRFIVVMVTLAVVAPWMGHQVAGFARDMFAASQAPSAAARAR